jgi:hypothetical protein
MPLVPAKRDYFARLLLVGYLCLASPAWLQAEETPTETRTEVQSHGVLFEAWIRKTFFDNYQPESYTQKWDIPAESNQRYGHIPVNPKATKYGTPVDMGDALRQFEVNEPFLLIVGFWREEPGDLKRYVKVIAPRIEPDRWHALFAPMTLADLQKLDAIVKDRDLDYREARKQAHALKNQPPYSLAEIVLNPKIDAHGQRRLQCSLSFDKIFKLFASEMNPAPENTPELFGIKVPGPFPSPPRHFTK